VNHDEAVALIGEAIPRIPGTWADLGAGDGTFTRALVELLGPSGRIVAVDRDARAVAAIKRWAKQSAPSVTALLADFADEFELPGPALTKFDGMLFANSLHFVPAAEAVLARLVARLRPGGRVVIVEYDQRNATRWVPNPIPVDRLPALVKSAGLAVPVIVATRPSAFGGTLYVATAARIAS
jgi:SAM-dependent methyltransferase